MLGGDYGHSSKTGLVKNAKAMAWLPHIHNFVKTFELESCTAQSPRGNAEASMLRGLHNVAQILMPVVTLKSAVVSLPRAVPRALTLRTAAALNQMPAVEHKIEQARDEHLVERTMDTLKAKRHAITTVESCTGGMIANLITNVGGAAEVYWGSVVTYDGSLKSDWGVPAGSIKEVGTVTEQVQWSSAVLPGNVIKAESGG